MSNNDMPSKEVEKAIKEIAIEAFKIDKIILDRKSIKLLFKNLCKHYDEPEFDWHDCNDCILRKIGDLYLKHGMGFLIERDVCFAIWHEDILIKN